MEPLETPKSTFTQQTHARLVLVRHGKPVIEPGLRPPLWRLSEDGYEGARALGQTLKNKGFDFHRIISSPEIKALGTANAIRAAFGGDAALETKPDLSEHARETVNFLPRNEFEGAIARFFSSDPSKVVFGEKTADAAFQRFAAVIQQEERLRESSGAETTDIIAVTHGTVLSLYVSRNLGIDPLPFWQELKMPTAVVISEGNRVSIIDAQGSASRWDANVERELRE